MNTPAAQLGFAFGSRTQRRVETPAARATDPISSHLAAEHITSSGARGYQQAQAAAAVRAFPGHTSFELALLTEINKYTLARRLPECVTAGTVMKGEIRECEITGRKALTWWPL